MDQHPSSASQKSEPVQKRPPDEEKAFPAHYTRHNGEDNAADFLSSRDADTEREPQLKARSINLIHVAGVFREAKHDSRGK